MRPARSGMVGMMKLLAKLKLVLEYVRKGTDLHSNTIGGGFSLIQRGLMGTFHSASRKHLPNYLNESQFRWNARKLNNERVGRAVKQLAGRGRTCVGTTPLRIGTIDS